MIDAEGFIDSFIAEKMSSGMTLQQAASSLHHALVALSLSKSLPAPTWSLSPFFPLLSLDALRLEGTRASGEVSSSCASLQPLPDGNHGENVSTGSGS